MRFSLKIGPKLILGFLVVVAIFGGVAYYQIRTFQNLANLQDVGAKRAEDALQIKDIVFRACDLYTTMANGVINQNLATTHKELEERKTILQNDTTTVQQLVDTEEERAWSKTFSDQYLAYFNQFEQEVMPILERSADSEKRLNDALAINAIARRVDDVYNVIADAQINRNVETTANDFEALKLTAQKDIATVREMADTTDEKAWAETFAEHYKDYLDHFEKEMLPLLQKGGETFEKRFADALSINAIVQRVNTVYQVMADGIINRNLDATVNHFEQIKQTAQQDMATVPTLVDTAEEQALVKAFTEQYTAYLTVFDQRMLPLLRMGENADENAIRQIDGQLDQIRDATLTPLLDILKSLELTSTQASQEMQTIRNLDGEIDTLREATLTPLNDILKSLEQESLQAAADQRKIRELDGQIDDLRLATFAPLTNINQSLAVETTDADQHFDETRQQAIRISVIISIAGGVAAMVFAIVMTISITRPLGQAVKLNNAIADGKLDVTVRVKRGDEIGQLQAAMKHMVEQLQEMVITVREGAFAVASGSQEMSQGASEQAAAAEEASSSMEQMAANIRQNAENAMQTEKIAVQASENAKESGKAVAETVKAMKDIAQKINIVEEIARQTHMLSLNATIEAAKAQEYGRGFAVVAAEVRSLAERSRIAATEINQITGSSVASAERAGELLNKLVPDIQKTAELVQEISAASREQSSGSEQINKAIQQLDQVIQQNASVSEELASQAEQLQSTIEFFKVKETTQENVQTTQSVGKKVAHIRSASGAKSETSSSEPAFVRHPNQSKTDERDAEFERY